MKKRLLSMLMAVLMIVSLVPAVSADSCETDHADKFSYSVAKDAAAKQPGVNVVVCNDCKKVIKSEVVAFAEKTDIQKCAATGHNWKTLELQKATCDKVGVELTYCADCGSVKSKDVVAVKDALKHSYTNFTVVVEPTCTESGWGYTVCDNCKNPEFVKDETAAVNLLPEDHTYALEQTVKAQFAPVNPKHTDYDELVAVTEVTVIDGKTLYPATKSQHSDTVDGKYVVKYEAKVTKDADGHYNVQFNEVDADKTHGGVDYTGDFYCPYCNYVKKVTSETKNVVLNKQHASHMTCATVDKGYYPYVDKVDGSKHDGMTDKVWCAECNAYFGGNVLPYDEYCNPGDAANLKVGQNFTVPAVAPTCTKTGWTEIKLTYTDRGWSVVDAGEKVEALGHHYAKVADVTPTCTKAGVEYDNYYACDRVVDEKTGKLCGVVKPGCTDNQKRTLDPLHDTASAFAYKQIVAPTCTTKGLSVKMCGTCGAYAVDADKEPVYYYVPAVDCVAGDPVGAKDATCTEVGATGDTFCKWCNTKLSSSKEIPMVDHTAVDVEAVAPTCTEAGATAGTKCSVCDKVLSGCEAVDALGHTFDKGVCTVCGAEDPDYVAPVAPEFTDAKDIAPYAGDAVAWAVANGIVNGRDDGSFDPKANVTRAELVVMLWRQAGEPESTAKVEFTDAADIPEYAVKAVAWAVEKGIVTGYEDNTFKPTADVTRAEFVKMLYGMVGTKVEAAADFSDVVAGEWYVDAINWAAAEEVTTGRDDGTFGVADNATREEAVTFLYRAFAE